MLLSLLQKNSKECRISIVSHVHTGKAMTFSENNSKCKRYLYLFSSESAKFLVCKSRSCGTLGLVIMSTNRQRVTLKSLKMSNVDDKQSNYRPKNVLFRTKVLFADFSKSLK